MNEEVFRYLKKYEHQLYFFTVEAKNVKEYFSVLLLNNNNNNSTLYSECFNYDELATKISLANNRSKHYKNILSMIRTDDALKIIIALLFKGFSWNNELFSYFNINNNRYVQNTLSTLHNLGLLIKERGIKINPYYYEALERNKDVHFRKSLHQANIYYITDEFVKFCSLMKDLFEFKINSNTSFKFSVKEIINDCELFESSYNDIMKEELTLMQRNRKGVDGVCYQTSTLKSLIFKNKVRKQIEGDYRRLFEKSKRQHLTSVESSKMRALSTIKKENNLTLIQKKDSNVKNIKKNIFYNGVEIDYDYLERLNKQSINLDEKLKKSKTEFGNEESKLLEAKNFKDLWGCDGKIVISDEGLSSIKLKTREQKNKEKKMTEEERAEDFLKNLERLTNE